MKLRFILLLLAIMTYSCAGSSARINVPNDPESITIQWLEWLDANQFDKLKEISSGNILTYVEDMEKFVDGVDEEEELEPTIVERINCEDVEDGKKECTYCCKYEEEETFVLKKEKGQWKVIDIIASLDELDEEALREERLLEEMLNQKLPKKSEEL